MITNCPDCGTGIGEPHKIDCNVERCSECGSKRFDCDCDCDGHDPMEAAWSGRWPSGAWEHLLSDVPIARSAQSESALEINSTGATSDLSEEELVSHIESLRFSFSTLGRMDFYEVPLGELSFDGFEHLRYSIEVLRTNELSTENAAMVCIGLFNRNGFELPKPTLKKLCVLATEMIHCPTYEASRKFYDYVEMLVADHRKSLSGSWQTEGF